MAPLIGLFFVFSYEGLGWWIGDDFATDSTLVSQILCVGILMNSLALVPYTLIQGYGYSKWTAKLHLIELPIYFAMLWFLFNKYGINGVAIAWSIRTSLDAILLFSLNSKLIKNKLSTLVILSFNLAISVMLFIFLISIPSLKIRALIFVIYLIVFATHGYLKILNSNEREFLARLIKKH
jgi:O-antigen/teichoic acid export membrane protein